MSGSREDSGIGAREIPMLSLVLGYGPMLPFAAGALLAWATGGAVRGALVDLTILWGCLIAVFLAGVRRGVSFLTPGGPRPAQIGTMLWLFGAGGGALLLWTFGWPRASLVLLAAVYLSIAVLDPIAARAGEAPAFFAKLRPTQMAVPVVCLLALVPLAARG